VGIVKDKDRHGGGFTLVEILVALAILGIVIPPVIGLFAAATESNQRSIRNTVALTLARDIMDRIKAGDINTLNQEQEIEVYKEKHGVEIHISGLGEGTGNSLNMLKIYVAPELGMDPKTKGIVLASYFANVLQER
jgi:prepilin-type N-terminal cleavage/methylation domain-containing protein